ncbi:sugar-binding transcriptional regulator [soil metagenome]
MDKRQSDDTDPDDTSLLVEVAKLYYEEQFTQAQIGRQLQTSRSTVSRLLKEARATGIVKVTIQYKWARDSALERDLATTFGLKQALVLRADGRGEPEGIEGLGYLAARYLETVVHKGLVLGVSYGRSLASTVGQVAPRPVEDLTVLQIIGALGSGNPLQDGPDLARQLANKYSATYRYLHAPLMVESRETRDRLLQEPLVKDLVHTARKADIVLTGVGPLTADASGLIFKGYLTKKDLSRLKKAGATGHICAQFYGPDGSAVAANINERAVTIGLDALRTIPTVVVVAGGAAKVAALGGALRGGYADVLVTDDVAARGVLKFL